MKLTYVSHASLFIEADSLKVLTDPWFFGPAYFDQWYVFPKPVDVSFVDHITHLIITHGHEDHLHIPTLKKINKDAKVYFPYTWQNGTKELLRDLGFKNITEVPAMRKVKLSSDFCFAFIVNGLDAFVIYENKQKVYVNLNDALNASHWAFVEIFTQKIRKKWPKIDMLICGLGGASYFPNTVHSDHKNDYEIAILREQFLAHKFCEIVEEIKPDIVFPFVPGFALLEKDKQWINTMKFPRDGLKKYYRDYFDPESQMDFYNLLPGDYVQDGNWVKSSSYHAHAIKDNLSHLLEDQYSSEIELANCFEMIDSDVLYELSDHLKRVLPVSSSGISKELLNNINFVIKLKDVRQESFIYCRYQNGQWDVGVTDVIHEDVNLTITTYSNRLNHALTELWGGDVFFIGYGADIYVLDDTCLEDNIDIVSLRLLSRFPAASYTMLRDPIRATRFLTNNPTYAVLAFKQKIQMRGNLNKLPYNERAHWISKSKCDVCRLCDIPLLSDEFGESLTTP